MADTFTVRISKDTPSFEEIDKAAEKLGLSRNQLIIEGIKMMCSWDEEFYTRLKQYSNTFRLPVPLVMQNMLIKRLAEDYAKEQVWGFTGKVMMEFMFNERGPITGAVLFKALADTALSDEVNNKVRSIEEALRKGLPVSQQDREFYEEHRVKERGLSPEEQRELFEKYGGPEKVASWTTEEDILEEIKKERGSE
jgi:hypothetical protein